MKTLLLAVALIGAFGAQDEDRKNRPVTKVVNLLKDMQKNLEKEGEEDEAIYNKMACWCKTNDAEKTQSIKDAEAAITDLTSKIEEYTATSARLNTEIKNLETEIEKSQTALADATALRKKELAEFNENEKDDLQSISALKSAVTVLSKHHSPPESALMDISHLMSHIAFRHSDMVSDHEQKTIQAFLQAPQDFFDAKPIFKQSYAPQSGEIFGILQNMLETFQANLSQAQKDEMAAQKAFEGLKAAKEEEIATAQEHRDDKDELLSKTDLDNANAKENLEDTRNSLSADQKFLMNLKEKCSMTDAEWEQRQKTRVEEIQAVSEAIAVLTSDESHDTFSRTFNFIQKSANRQVSKRREAAAKILANAAMRLGKPVLSNLATKVRLDAFTRVKAAIDDMVATLLKEKEDEIKHKDFCTDELNQNDKNEAETDRTKANLEAKIDTLTNDIATLKSEIENLRNEISELNTQLKRAGEDREAANKEYQATVADQRATVALLNKALASLNKFYGKSLVQVSRDEPAGPPPPAGFSEYKHQEGSTGVIALINQIISDAKVMEAEAVTAEKDAQVAYETIVRDTNASIENKQNQIVDKSDEKANKNKAKQSAELNHQNAVTELEELANAAAALHKACDFVLKNFDLRQTARDQEVEALRQAKSILSGAKFDLLQFN